MFRKFIFFICIFFAAVCTRGADFPLCIYGVDSPHHLQIIKDAGFDCFQTYKQDPQLLASLAAEAKKLGLKALFYPYRVIGSPHEKEAQDWAMLAWYLIDEPDVHKWTLEQLQQKEAQVKAAFPQHKTAFVIGQGKTAVPYYSAADIIMVDWYPVPHLQLASFGEQVALTKQGNTEAGQPQKPLLGVVQAFDWREYNQTRPDNDRIGRFPTVQEIRFMTYHGILNGATGIFYFIFTSNNIPLPEVSPAHWGRITTVSAELAALKPVLEQGKKIKKTLSMPAGTMQQTWKYKSKKYTVILNTSAQAMLLPKKLLNKKYSVFTGKAKPSELEAYGTLILVY